jgi:hypothetical protein
MFKQCGFQLQPDTLCTHNDVCWHMECSQPIHEGQDKLPVTDVLCVFACAAVSLPVLLLVSRRPHSQSPPGGCCSMVRGVMMLCVPS